MTSIKDFENYLIFEDGVIINIETGKEVKPSLDKSLGYYRIGLTKNKKQKYYYLHRLLAEAYIPNPDNKPCIDHINRIRTDYRIENLRWATHSENMQNKSKFNNNTSGTTNVSYVKRDDKWYYQKMINGVSHRSPGFDTPEEAIEYKDTFEFVESVL
jgi:hypothetical protein